jgi:hypothetical protein
VLQTKPTTKSRDTNEEKISKIFMFYNTHLLLTPSVEQKLNHKIEIIYEESVRSYRPSLQAAGLIVDKHTNCHSLVHR